MTAFALRAFGGARVQDRPGACVLALVPASLNFGVAVTARRLLGGCVVVAEKSLRCSRRVVEGLPVPENDVLARTPSQRGHGKKPGRKQAWSAKSCGCTDHGPNLGESALRTQSLLPSGKCLR